MKLNKELENVSTKTILKLKLKEFAANAILGIGGMVGLFALLMLAALLTSCNHTPKFKAGDCIASEDDIELANQLEFIEEKVPTDKILKVGKNNYLYDANMLGITMEWSIKHIDRNYIKVECPKRN